MKKVILFVTLFFVAFTVFAQTVSSPGVICYNLTRDEMIEFNQNSEQGELRIEERYDGLYVVGKGILMPISSREEGQKFIDKKKKTE